MDIPELGQIAKGIAALAGIATILTFLLNSTAQAFLKRTWRRITRYRPSIPSETIRIVPRRAEWNLGRRGNTVLMQVNLQALVTNVTDRPTIIACALLSRGWFRKNIEGQLWPGQPIPPQSSVEITSLFWVEKPLKEEGESLKAKLLLVDNLGNEHKTKTVEITSRKRGPSAREEEEKKYPQEAIHSISDPTEKRIVAILKDEVIRYRECGRQVGGLGSVQVTYHGRTLNGIGYQGRKANSPSPQWLVPDPSNASIHSDNLASLSLVVEENDSAEHVSLLLIDRIKSGNEYSPIGYFFLLALFRLGNLPGALQAIRHELVADENFAFDNAMMMLSGLLQYEHPQFDDELLDEVERLSGHLKDNPHHLRERCIATRALLAKSPPNPPHSGDSEQPEGDAS